MQLNSFTSKRIWPLISLFLFIHFGFGFLLNLSTDEAHYALYGLHPDWSYFDHPPLVGWIQILPIWLGANDGLLRLIPETLWLISNLISVQIVKEIIEKSGPELNIDKTLTTKVTTYAQWFTVACISLSPIIHVLAVGLLPDTLLMAIVPSMIWLTLKLKHALSEKKDHDLSWWIILGVVLGIAGLSKYTAVFFALAIPSCLIVWQGWAIFKRPGLWLCLLIASTLISPIIYWNLQHHWISFIYQLNHCAGGIWKPHRILSFLLTQLATYGLLMPIGLIYCFQFRVKFQKSILLFSIIPFSIFAYMSGGGGSLPHWTSSAWIALSPISSIGLALAWLKNKHRLISVLMLIQAIICALGFALLFFGGLPGVTKNDRLGEKNPLADLYGWKNAGEHASSLAKKYNTTNLAVQNWTLASRLAWYSKPLPVYVLDDRYDQFDIWFGDLKPGESAIVVNFSGMSFTTPTQAGAFKSCKTVDNLDIYRIGRIISSFDFLLCSEWGGKPNPIRISH